MSLLRARCAASKAPDPPWKAASASTALSDVLTCAALSSKDPLQVTHDDWQRG
jgi:hypothetical protein